MTEPIPLGAFDLLEPIGRGGMGEVWRGVHRAGGMPVAIKIVRADLARVDQLRALFRREVRAAASLDHPNIVLLFDQGEIDADAAERSEGRLQEGAPYLVMEWASGGTLSSRAPMPWPELSRTLAAVLDALAHAHARGVIHRDLKLSNVLVSTDEDLRGGPKLADFGIALLRDERGEDAAVVGTRGYMAPEQAADLWRDEGPWTDLYALGVLAWKLATRTAPPPMLFEADLPDEGFEAWVRRLIEPDPQLRFRRAADAARALARVRPELRAGSSPSLLREPATESAEVPAFPREADTVSASKVSAKTESGWDPPTFPARVTTAEGLGPDRRQPIGDWRGASAAMTASLRFSGAGIGLVGVRSIPMVDRDAERDLAWAALRDARTSPQAIVIAGPAGIGKSRLAQWLSERAHELGAATVLTATHAPLPGSGDGVAAMFARHLGCADLDHESVEWRVRDLFELHDGPDDEGEATAIATWLLTPDRIGAAERTALALRSLTRLARERPLIVRIENAEWAEEALALAARALSTDVPALFAITVRDEALVGRPLERARIAGLPRRIDLGPLEPEQRALLMRGLLGLSSELAARIEERAGGNPLFAVELVAEWARAGALVPTPDGFTLRDASALALPDGLTSIWRGSIEGAPEALEIAAALGHDVDEIEWRRACAAHGIAPAGLEALLGRGLAKSTVRGFSFAHGMLREALLERAGARTAAHHRACAAAVEGERRARHLLAAGDARAAIAPILEAAEARLAGGEAGRAEALLADLSRALGDDPTGRGAILVRLAEAHRQHARYDEAEELAAQAEEIGDAGVVARAFAVRGAVARERGHPEETEMFYQAALERAEAAGDARLAASCARWVGIACIDRGDAEGALPWLERSLDGGDPLMAARTRVTLAVAARMLGDKDGARAHLERALDEMREVGARGGVADVLNALGELARANDEPGRAADLYRRAAALHESLGSRSEAVARMNLGFALIDDGRESEARPVLLAALHTLERQGRRGLSAMAHVALLTCATGDPEAWDRHVQLAEQLLGETGFCDLDVATAAERAAQKMAGDPDRADRAWHIAIAQWRALGRAEDAARADQQRRPRPVGSP